MSIFSAPKYCRLHQVLNKHHWCPEYLNDSAQVSGGRRLGPPGFWEGRPPWGVLQGTTQPGEQRLDQEQLCRLFTCETNILETSKKFEMINLVRVIYTCQGDPKNVVGTLAWAAASRRGSGGGASSVSHGPTIWEVRKDTGIYIFSHHLFFLSSLGFWGVCYYPFDILVAIPSAPHVPTFFYFSTK